MKKVRTIIAAKVGIEAESRKHNLLLVIVSLGHCVIRIDTVLVDLLAVVMF